MRTRILLPLVVVALAACTGGATTSATTPTSTPAPSTATPSGVDPLVPYSPATTPFAERTSGFIPDTLTLPTTGGGSLYVTPVTTTMTTTFVNDTRALAVYLTLENPGKEAWTGNVGERAELVDQNDATFPAVQPAKGDEHPHPGQYGGENRNLLDQMHVPPGATVKGVLVFHPTGGNRPITLRISLDGGTTWASWTTALGVF
jgi:hypothetical protein